MIDNSGGYRSVRRGSSTPPSSCRRSHDDACGTWYWDLLSMALSRPPSRNQRSHRVRGHEGGLTPGEFCSIRPIADESLISSFSLASSSSYFPINTCLFFIASIRRGLGVGLLVGRAPRPRFKRGGPPLKHATQTQRLGLASLDIEPRSDLTFSQPGGRRTVADTAEAPRCP